MRAALTILTFALSLALAPLASAKDGQASANPPAGRDCFLASQINGWGVIDGRTLRVRINSQRQYALRTVGSARRIRWEWGIAVTSWSGWICTGDGVGVEIHVAGEMPRSWLVEDVARLPPPEPS